MIYGYVRRPADSTPEELTEVEKALVELGVANAADIFWDVADNKEQPELRKLLDQLETDDTLASPDVAHVAASVQQLAELMDMAAEQHLRLLIGPYTIDCRGEIDERTQGMIQMTDLFTTLEQHIISERIKTGLASARARGAKIGRPQLTTESVPQKFWKYYPAYRDKHLTVTDLAQLVGVSRTTVYRYIRIAKEQGDLSALTGLGEHTMD